MISNTLQKVETMTGYLSGKLVLACPSLKIRKQNAQNDNLVYRDKNWVGSNFLISNEVHLVNNTVFATILFYLCHKAPKILELNRLIINTECLIFHIYHVVLSIQYLVFRFCYSDTFILYAREDKTDFWHIYIYKPTPIYFSRNHFCKNPWA